MFLKQYIKETETEREEWREGGGKGKKRRERNGSHLLVFSLNICDSCAWTAAESRGQKPSLVSQWGMGYQGAGYLTHLLRPFPLRDSSCVWYYGDSYLKFQNVFLNQQNNISLEFQTSKSSGLLLYIKQDSDSVDAFFTQLYIENDTLKYHFRCAGELKLKSMNTTFRVHNGQKYTLHIRPCKGSCI